MQEPIGSCTNLEISVSFHADEATLFQSKAHAVVKHASGGATPFQLAADFKMRMTATIVFQLRVVAGAPKSLSSWPRQLMVFM